MSLPAAASPIGRCSAPRVGDHSELAEARADVVGKLAMRNFGITAGTPAVPKVS